MHLLHICSTSTRLLSPHKSVNTSRPRCASTNQMESPMSQLIQQFRDVNISCSINVNTIYRCSSVGRGSADSCETDRQEGSTKEQMHWDSGGSNGGPHPLPTLPPFTFCKRAALLKQTRCLLQ